MPVKKGRLTREDMAFIEENVDQLTVEQIAEKLNRSVETVEKTIRVHGKSWTRAASPEPELDATPLPLDDPEQITIREELLRSERWKRLKSEFTEEELRLFEEQYIGLMSQFKGDVLHTEEGQIFDAITLEVLKSRNLISRKQAREEISRLELMQEKFANQHPNVNQMSREERDFVLALQAQLQVAIKQEQDRTNEWSKLQERVERIRSSLKANRDQRVKDAENAGKDFLGTLKWLASRDVQKQKGRELELVKLAGQKEFKRLGEPTQYEDGSIDSPILSADTSGQE